MLIVRKVVPMAFLAAVALAVSACTATGNASGTSTSAASVPSTAASSAPTVTVPPVAVSSTTSPSSSSAPAATSSATSSVVTSLTSTKSSVTTKPPVLPPVAKVSASPAFGTSDLSPIEPVTIKVVKGRIETFSLTNAAGTVVKGAMSADGSSWTLAEDLGYAKTYTATGTAVGTDGKAVKFSGVYSTLDPNDQIGATLSPGDGQTVGVAEPIILSFHSELNPTQRAAIQKRLKVTPSVPVVGAWAWIHHDGYWGIDWRPKVYWPENISVHVDADLYGVELADGIYGEKDLTSDFTIGRNQVVLADAAAHTVTVQRDGQTVAVYPASFGSGDVDGEPDRVTRSGTYAVMDKSLSTVMKSTTFHYSETEYWDVRISDNGEFLHENPATVGDQGHVNVSHGCVNLSKASAEAYYHSAIIGDPVVVSNTSVKLSPADGDDFDWAVPWSEWQSLSAL